MGTELKKKQKLTGRTGSRTQVAGRPWGDQNPMCYRYTIQPNAEALCNKIPIKYILNKTLYAWVGEVMVVCKSMSNLSIGVKD